MRHLDINCLLACSSVVERLTVNQNVAGSIPALPVNYRIVGKRALVFTNSAGEYGAGVVNITFCPICGRELVEE